MPHCAWQCDNHFRQFCPKHDFYHDANELNSQHCAKVCCQPRHSSGTSPSSHHHQLVTDPSCCCCLQCFCYMCGVPAACCEHWEEGGEHPTTHPACIRTPLLSPARLRKRWCMHACKQVCTVTAMHMRGASPG
jgi:hypothetical protein